MKEAANTGGLSAMINFRLVAAIVVGAGMLGGIVFAICGSYHGIRAAYCRREDAPFRWIVALNRFNAAWFADQLNAEGLYHRSQAFKFQKWALGCWVVMAVLAGILFLSR